MFLLNHLFFLLAPAAVLSAPHTGPIEASHLSARAELAAAVSARASFYVDPRHVIELRHHEISADTVIEVPPDQMSGSVRVHYDPDLEPTHEEPIQEGNDKSLEQGTSPVPVSDLVRRSVLTEAICREYKMEGVRGPFELAWAQCIPEDPQAYKMVCKYHFTNSGELKRRCPEKEICFQTPPPPGRPHSSDIICKTEEEATKVKSKEGIRGLLKTVTKIFSSGPKGYKKLIHEVFVFDVNAHLYQIFNIKGINDGQVFRQKDDTNGLFAETILTNQPSSIFWQADAGRSYAVLEWSWRRM